MAEDCEPGEPVPEKNLTLSDRYHKAINKAFENYGCFVARHPLIPLIIGIVLLGGLCLGIMRIEKETDIEVLWVDSNSRLVEEKKFVEQRFGGTPREQSVTITPLNTNPNLDLKLAMDALTEAISPLYDKLHMRVAIEELREGDFCERPLVPDSIKPGKNPVQQKNYLSWGYSRLANCSIRKMATSLRIDAEMYGLPDGWGIDWLPCFKLSPMDCFREGGDFDYPLALQQLEQKVASGRLVDYTVYWNLQSKSCQMELNTSFIHLFRDNNVQVDQNFIDELIKGVVEISQIFVTWGYKYRKSYKNMTSDEILSHINKALINGKSQDPNPASTPQVVSCIINNAPCCLTWFGFHSPILSALGGLEYGSSASNITKIDGIRWGANNYHHEHPVWNRYIQEKLNMTFADTGLEHLTKSWESVMIKQLDPLRRHEQNTSFGKGEPYGSLQLEFNMWRSTEDIVADANKVPIWQIILSAILVFVYAFLAFANFRDPVHSHSWLACTGIVVVAVAIIAGFGLSAILGVKLTPLAGSVVPFLALGLGIDDVFVLVSMLRIHMGDPILGHLSGSDGKVPENEMKMTLALAGPSVLLTTLSVLASFFISSLTPLPLVRWFCWQMGITATIHTFGMLLVFTPIMSMDAQRAKAKICDPSLWLLFGIRRRKDSASLSLEKRCSNSHMQHSAFENNAKGSFISTTIAKYYAPLFGSNLFKSIMVLLFVVLLVAMSYIGFVKLETGLRLSDITLKGSYQNSFTVTTEDKFLDYEIWYVTRDIDLAKEQVNLLNTYLAFQSNMTKWAPPQPRVLEASVLEAIILFGRMIGTPLNDVTLSNLSLHTIPPNNFSLVQSAWASSLVGHLTAPNFYCENKYTKKPVTCFPAENDPNITIGATITSMMVGHLGTDTAHHLEMIRTTRRVSDDMNKGAGKDIGFVYGYPFLFYEQYLHSKVDLYKIVGFGLIGVFLAVLVFQFSIIISVIIIAVLLMVELEVYGFIYLIGGKLNALSLVNLGIVIGMASEFTYLARSFLLIDGTKNKRVGKALEWTFEPLLHGLGTQIVATLPLLLLKYHAFRVYYFGMFTIMGIVGFVNGFVLLPVLLSWFGPSPLPHARKVLCEVDEKKGTCVEMSKDPPLN